MWLVVSIILLAAIVVMGVSASNRGSRSAREAGESSTPFAGVTVSAQPLMNATELSVYRALLQVVVPHGYQVFPQVAMSALIEISPNRQSERSRYDRKYVDFAIVRTTDWKCAMVVEVDGPSHERARQKERDQTKDAALGLAGIQVKRLQVRQYTLAEIAQEIGLAVAGVPGSGTPARSGR